MKMNKKLYLLPFLVLCLSAQDNTEPQLAAPVINDLDLLVESVKNSASIRDKEDKARLAKFLSDNFSAVDTSTSNFFLYSNNKSAK